MIPEKYVSKFQGFVRTLSVGLAVAKVPKRITGGNDILQGANVEASINFDPESWVVERRRLPTRGSGDLIYCSMDHV